MKSFLTRRLGEALLVYATLLGSPLLPPTRAAPDPPSPKAKPGGPVTTTAPAVPATPVEDVVRHTRNVAGESKPILLSADEFATWVEKGHRLILMKGQVLIQQGVVRLRCEEAVAFINLERLQKTGLLHADVYAEQKIKLEDGKADRKGNRAILDLTTRGELKMQSHKKGVLQQPIPDAPLFQRTIVEIFGPQTPGGDIVPTGGKQTVPVSREKKPAPIETKPFSSPMPPPTLSPMSTPVLPKSGLPDPSKPLMPPSGNFATPPLSLGEPYLPRTMVVRASGAELPSAEPKGKAKAKSTQRTPTPQPAGPGAPAVSPTPAPGSRLLPPTSGVDGPLRQYSVAPRTGSSFQLKSETLPNGEQASIFTGGVIISVRAADGSNMLDIEADNALIWTREGLTRAMVDQLRSPEGQTSKDLEFYFSGHVQVRSQTEEGSRLLQAEEIYLDARRNVAIALNADLKLTRKGLEQPVHLRAQTIHQLSENRFEALQAEIFASKLPSDPGLKVFLTTAVVEEIRVPRTTLFGKPIVDKEGKQVIEIQRPVKGTGAFIEFEDVPIFYLPWYQGDASDPMGPLEAIRIGGSGVFGFQAGVSLDIYDLFSLQPLPDARWLLDLDYLSKRGPALGTTFDFASKTFFGMDARATTQVKAYGLHDAGVDNLGGLRKELDDHPDFRGRFLFRQNVQDLPDGFVLQTQLNALSDRNFLEQFFKTEFDTDYNQSTYLYVKQSQGSWAWTGLVEPRLRNWVTETEWLPRLDGYLLGYRFLDLFTYNAHASIGYANLRTSHDPLPPVSPTDVSTSTGRGNIFQEVSVPFSLGPVRMAPYAVGDAAYYTNDLTGDDSARLWGGLGLKSSLPLTRLYPDAKSLLFNVEGLMHKIVLSSNYLYSGSSDSFLNYPQLDRLNDDATDQSLRDFRPVVPTFYPDKPFLLNSPLYDPQLYAIRRLVDNRIDTHDDMQVLQLDVRQRLQTKRGFPGREHTVDWMTLDLSASIFPAADRDNFGETVSFLEYDYLWNIGDRTALVSTGWVDPIENGARVFTIGAYLDRPDRTSFYLGYRQIDPIESRAVTGAVTYIFSPKYAMTGSSTYDFGTRQSLSNSIVFTRMGSDLNVGLGFTYNAIQNDFGILFEILPNLLKTRSRHRGGVPDDTVAGR